VLAHLVGRSLLDLQPGFSVVSSCDFLENFHCLRIHVFLENVDCFLDPIVILMGAKLVDEFHREWTVDSAPEITGIGLSLPRGLVVTDVLDEVLDVGVAEAELDFPRNRAC
jgi:hypothetical protein